MEGLICTLLILCVVFVNLRVCSGEEDLTSSVQEYFHMPRPTPRKELPWIEYTTAAQLDLFKLAAHAISRRSE